MIKKIILFWISCFFILATTFAQHRKIPFQEFSFKLGMLIQSPRSDGDIIDRRSLGGTLGFGYQTTGNSYWETFFKYPKYGMRIGYIDYFADIFGKNVSLYAFIQAPFFKYNKFSFEYSLGFGLGYYSKLYNIKKNPQNDYISTHLSACIDLSLIFEYELSSKINVFMGGNFAHFSNGATHLPNLGTNGLSGFCGLRFYQAHKNTAVFNNLIEKPIIPKNEIYVFYAPSFMQWRIDGFPETFFASTFEVGYKRRFHPCLKWGAGIDIIYTGYEMLEVSRENPSYWNNISQAFFGSFELLFGKVSLQVALGYYTYYSTKPRGKVYERAGLFYHFGNKFEQFAGVSIKAAVDKADYIEWTYGFKIKTF